jgi:hypothetical protein
MFLGYLYVTFEHWCALGEASLQIGVSAMIIMSS